VVTRVALIGRIGAAVLTLASVLSLCVALELPKSSPASSIAGLPAQPVGSAALFEALTRAGPPGLGDELRAVNALIEQHSADSAAAHRLSAVIARLDKTEAMPAILLGRMADRLDAAMVSLREASTQDHDLQNHLIILSAALGVTAALLGLAMTPGPRSQNGSNSVAAMRVPLSGSDTPPMWAQTLPARLEAAVREATATMTRLSHHDFTTPNAVTMIAADERPEDAKQPHGNTARQTAANSGASGSAGGLALDRVDQGAHRQSDFAGLRLLELADRLEDLLDGLAAATSQVVQHAKEKAESSNFDRLQSVAASLEGAALPLATLAAGAKSSRYLLDDGIQTLTDIARPLLSLVQERLPPSFDKLEALGERFETQIEAVSTSGRVADRMAQLVAKLEDVTDSIPSSLDHLGAVADRLDRQAENADGAAGRALDFAARLERAGAVLPLMVDQLAELGKGMEAQMERGDGLSSRVVNASETLDSLSGILLPALARLDGIGESLGGHAARNDAALSRIETIVDNLRTFDGALPQAVDRLINVSNQLEGQANATQAAGVAVGRVAEVAARLAIAGEALPTTLDRLATIGTSFAERAERADGVMATVTDLAGRLENNTSSLMKIAQSLPIEVSEAASALAQSAAHAAALVSAETERSVTDITRKISDATNFLLRSSETSGGLVPGSVGTFEADTDFVYAATTAGRLVADVAGSDGNDIASMLRTLNGVERDIERLAALSGEFSNQGNSHMPELVIRNAQGLMTDLQTAIRRLNSVASALNNAFSSQGAEPNDGKVSMSKQKKKRMNPPSASD
jgi:ABC-type transporter Mla subunit MlaD